MNLENKEKVYYLLNQLQLLETEIKTIEELLKGSILTLSSNRRAEERIEAMCINIPSEISTGIKHSILNFYQNKKSIIEDELKTL